jgi:hypothetical protein
MQGLGASAEAQLLLAGSRTDSIDPYVLDRVGLSGEDVDGVLSDAESPARKATKHSLALPFSGGAAT